MEHFHLAFSSPTATVAATPGAALCGVVASGNLEVLVEAARDAADAQICRFEIHTAAEGFRETWQAVLQDFCHRHAAGGLCFLLNDVGATPAVVALRLAQAHESWVAAGGGTVV